MIDAHRGLARHSLPSFETPDRSVTPNVAAPMVFMPIKNTKKSFLEDLLSIVRIYE